MRLLFIFLVVSLLLTSCSAQSAESKKAPDGERKTGKSIVLVELFTSEGCSSCPPADQALAFLTKQDLPDIEVIPLALHVDYWDSSSWRDKFSSHSYTERQQDYARRFKLDSTYTPQMVVDGKTEFVGSNLRAANAAIMESVKAQKGKVEATADKDKLNIKISDLPGHEKATIYVAITEDALASNVTGGENNGSRFEHSSVVRKMMPVSVVDAGTGKAELVADITADPEWKPENLNIVVFVQEDNSGKIIAVARAPK